MADRGPDWQIFDTSAGLASALASRVAQALGNAIAERGRAFIAVSGGTTPALFFRELSQATLDWRRVVVTLCDERFVERTSPRANAGLVRANLLRNEAAAARFVDLYEPAPDVEAAAKVASQRAGDLPWPLDVAILGMGTDGHTASFFPDADALESLLDPTSEAVVLPVHATSAGEPRLTLPLARITAARLVIVHIEGEAKRAVLDQVLNDEPNLPIGAVLAQTKRPVSIFWAP